MRALNARLNELNQKRHERDVLSKRLEQLGRQKLLLAMRLEALQNELKEEKSNLETLEKVTFSSVVNALLSGKVEKLEAEKEKVYKDQLKYEQTKDEYNQLLRELDYLSGKLREYDAVEQSYLHVVADVEKQILKYKPSEAASLRVILGEKESHEKEIRQCQEAINLATEVLSELNMTRKNLEKAKLWGDYDVSGGGTVATIQKYAYLDEAQEQLHKIQWMLRKYHNELEGLWMKRIVDMEVGSFLEVADDWIEGVFEDRSIPNAVQKLLDSLDKLIAKVLEVDEAMRKTSGEAREKLEMVDGKLETFLTDNF
ncbi:hypothetical protein [Anaerotalea alkaliphila]|uniref:Uncharacterized protein n=1 Tax=Anaerotalea alkaliphila TaxID=2662126 RepID=A0A7X5HTI2_9FIRM|nr:hypothetical protein [Anaerotalea alkaliphila]NDL66354.1 hypothetical protein [Anaerotalea alkaliphila]